MIKISKEFFDFIKEGLIDIIIQRGFRFHPTDQIKLVCNDEVLYIKILERKGEILETLTEKIIMDAGYDNKKSFIDSLEWPYGYIDQMATFTIITFELLPATSVSEDL